MIFILWAIFFLFHSNDTNGLVGSHIYVYGALRLFFAILAYYYRVVGKYPLETRASCSYSLEFLKRFEQYRFLDFINQGGVRAGLFLDLGSGDLNGVSCRNFDRFLKVLSRMIIPSKAG
jgi:hypothetical protein